MSTTGWREAFTDDGHFLGREGPACPSPGAKPTYAKKLCLTSTDWNAMGELLHALSLRDDCWFVKLDRAPLRNGMVRGRAFFTNENAVIELWKRYKVTEQFLCTIQDDDLTAPHR